MSNTPTTDAMVFECHDEGRKVVDPEFAQALERLLRRAVKPLKDGDPYEGGELATEIEQFLGGAT